MLREDDEVRISAHLIHAATDMHLWTDSYQRSIDKVLRLQREVASTIAAAVHVTLSPDERRELAAAPTVDPEVLDAVLKGDALSSRLTSGSFRAAQDCYQRALQMDPQSARAQAGLAWLNILHGYWSEDPTTPYFATAEVHARKALALDPQLAGGHAFLGAVLTGQWQFASAEESFRRAIELRPNFAYGHFLWGINQWFWKPIQIRLDLFRRATELDPYEPHIKSDTGMAYYLAGGR